MTSPPSAATAFRAGVVALPPAWRAVAAALEVFARGSLLAMVAALLFAENPPTNPLAQMRMFAGLFLAPELAAWCIGRAFAGRLSVDNGTIVLEQTGQRAEIPVTSVTAVEAWPLPLPATGFSLRLESGRRWEDGIVCPDPAGVAEALVAQGGRASILETLASPAVTWARARLANRYGFLERPLVKFVIFALVPALPAFRLHQYITYGGTFGEYQMFGLQAYLLALGIWWVSWAIGLVLFAAVLRAAIEALTILLVLVMPAWTSGGRRILEVVGRLLYYVGVPAWLLIRLWPW